MDSGKNILSQRALTQIKMTPAEGGGGRMVDSKCMTPWDGLNFGCAGRLARGYEARKGEAARAERLELRFTPASSSWMNLVERFFHDLTVDCVRDGSFGS